MTDFIQELQADDEEKYGPLANTLAELATIIRDADRHAEKEGDSSSTDELCIKARLSAIKLRPRLEMAIGVSAAKDFYNELSYTIKFYEGDDEAGGHVFISWCGSEGKAEKIAQKLDQWHHNILLLTNSDGKARDTAKKHEKPKLQAEKLSAKAKALATLVEHPDWSNTKIAEAAGISRTTLYDYPEFKAARKMQKQNKEKIPRGRKDQEGNVEAIDE